LVFKNNFDLENSVFGPERYNDLKPGRLKNRAGQKLDIRVQTAAALRNQVATTDCVATE
jgi:hypothetical protein